MSPPTGQEIGALAECFHQIETVDAPTGALGQSVFLPQNDARPVILAGHPARHNAYHPGMPVLAEQHDAMGIHVLFLHHPFRDLGNGALDLLPFAVEPVQLPRGVDAESGVLAENQLHRQRGIREAAACVDPRSEPEGNVHRLNLLAGLQARNVHQRPQAPSARVL